MFDLSADCLKSSFYISSYLILSIAALIGIKRNNSDADDSRLAEKGSESCCQRRGHSSVAEHPTADREVPGSNPGGPYFMFGE